MASPQCENGHVRIADELFEAILRADFSKRELLVALAVIRKTYGYRKTMDRISSSQIAELTGIAPQHCRAAIRELKARRVIREGGPKRAGKEAQNGPHNIHTDNRQ
jgi:phage replication O-like protein O